MRKKYQRNKSQRQATVSRKEHGIRHGYRSGLEDKIAKQISGAGHEIIYETDKVHYVVPERNAKYTPDFKLPKKGGFFYVETKGIWDTADRQKHLLIKEQHPDVDIRFVFSNCNNKLYKGSKTTYASYCDKYGFAYAHKTIPDEWLQESQQE
jgi:predicted nuclease of restriction endonuclease-like RecB superfamily